MQSVKQSPLVLNRASNWRDGFVNVVRLATSEPEHNPEGWTEKYGFGAGSDGLELGRRSASRRGGGRDLPGKYEDLMKGWKEPSK